MNRRTFFGMLAGLAGAGALKRKPSMGYTLYQVPYYPEEEWKNARFRCDFVYAVYPGGWGSERIILHKREIHETEIQS